MRRPIALKIFTVAPEVDHGEAMRRLGRVARRAACIRHPSFIHVFEVDRTGAGDDARDPCLLMELVEGESLMALVDGWRSDGLRVPIDFGIVVSLRTAEALGAALFTDDADGGLTGLVHGDLSPRQILISSQGDVKVGGFGETTIQGSSSHVRSRARLAYTAPEVASGDPANARSDVFSLGIILHELLVGPRFACGTSMADAIQMVREGEIHTSVLEPNLPRSLRNVILQATAPDPMERYAHARAMAFDLRREMLRLGLTDAQTSVRHAIVGWCEVRGSDPPARQQSDIVPRAALEREDAAPPSENTNPSIPMALRRRR